MHTCSSSNLIVESFTIPKRHNRRRSKQIVEPELHTIVETPVVTMLDMRTMSELLKSPTEGYGDAIVIPTILRDDPLSHIRWFNKITSTLKYKNVSYDAIKLMLFPFSLEGDARTWLEKEPPRFIHTWEDLVSKFVNYFFPYSKTTNLKNNITNFQQKFEETFSEAWDHFKDFLRKCPHHATSSNLLNGMPRDALTIIENKSKVRTSRNKPVVSKVNTTTSSSSHSSNITALTDMVKDLVLMNKVNEQAFVKFIEETCITCGGPHSYYECLATDSNILNAFAATGTYNQGGAARTWLEKEPPRSIHTWEDLVSKFVNYFFPPSKTMNLKNNITNFQQKFEETFSEAWDHFKDLLRKCPHHGISTNEQASVKFIEETCVTCGGPHSYYECLATDSNTLNAFAATGTYNQGANPRGDINAITTRSGVSYDGPMIPPTSSPLPKEVECETEATKDKLQPTSLESTTHVQPPVVQVLILEPEVALKTNPKPLHFDISFTDALHHMPKFASTFKSLLSNKEKLFKLASTLLNENCSAVLLKKLPEKLGDHDKFLISCDFIELEECLALADLCASINLMPLSAWNKLSRPELTPTPDFVVVDYDVDPRVPLILGRPFLRTERALIDVHGEELTLRVNDEAITFKVRHTSRYSRNYYDETVYQVNVIDVACDEYAQEVFSFLDSSKSGDPTPSNPIIASSSPLFTPFERSDFILEEIETCLRFLNELSNLEDDDFDSEGDIALIEKLLNEDPSLNLLPMKNEDLKQADVTMTKPFDRRTTKTLTQGPTFSFRI
nr:reverse transcriptase domain-containing protein [Tanacetum cinerariifolium]